MRNEFVPHIPTVNLREFGEIVRKAALIETETGIQLNICGWSKPGVGKSQKIEQVCKSMGRTDRDLRMGNLFPADIQGNPMNIEISGDDFESFMKQAYSHPYLLPHPHIDGEKGMLIFNEFNMANPTVMGMAQQLLDSRRIGQSTLPHSWSIVSLNNLRGHGAHVNTISTPVASRFIHFNIVEDLTIWIEDFATKHIDPIIIAYLLENPHHFYIMPQSGEMAYPCPRTWHKASAMYRGGLENYLAAAIGEAVAINFSTFQMLKDELPNWAAIEADPNYVWKSNNPSAQYVVMLNLVQKLNKKNAKRYLSFIEKNLGLEYWTTAIESIFQTLTPTNPAAKINKEDVELFTYIAREITNSKGQHLQDFIFLQTQLREELGL